jgi:transaldolase/glucose-6-phosphate isomerase
MNPLLRLRDAGQSVWLDYLRRSLIIGGELERLVREDGISGVTSNPSIFGKAIRGSTDYDDAIRAIGKKEGRSPVGIAGKLEDVHPAQVGERNTDGSRRAMVLLLNRSLQGS